MKHHIHVTIATILAALMCASAWAEIELSCDSLVIRLDEENGRITSARIPQLNADLALKGGLRVTEGVEAREITLGRASVSGGQSPLLRFAPEGEELAVEARITPRNAWFAWEVKLRNAADRQRLLALSLPLEVPGDGPIAAYDGFLPTEALTEAFDGPMYRTPIPLCAAWSEAGGAATGINAREHLSFVATSGEPLPRAWPLARTSCSTRGRS